MLGFSRYSWRGRPSARVEDVDAARGVGLGASIVADPVLTFLVLPLFLPLLALSACAVGPDFAPPPAPPVSGYTPDGQPATTASSNVAGGVGAKIRRRARYPGRVVDGIPFQGARRFDRRCAARPIRACRRRRRRCGRRRKISTPRPASSCRRSTPRPPPSASNSHRSNSARPVRRPSSICTRRA